MGYWIKSLCGSLAIGASEAEDRDAAVVIARTRPGQDHILLRSGTYGQAKRARNRFESELERIGEEEFRRRYGLPEVQ